MVCEEMRGKIDEYLDGALSPEEAKRFEEHMSSCPDCSEELRLARAVLKALGELGEIEVPSDFLGRVHEKIDAEKARSRKRLIYIRRAGALAACIVLAAAVYSGFDGAQFEKNGNEMLTQERMENTAAPTPGPTAAPAADTAVPQKEVEPEVTVQPTQAPKKQAPKPAKSAPAKSAPAASATPAATVTPTVSAAPTEENAPAAAAPEVATAHETADALPETAAVQAEVGAAALTDDRDGGTAMFSASTVPEEDALAKRSGGGAFREANGAVTIYVAAGDAPRAREIADRLFPDGYFAADGFVELCASLDAENIEYFVSGEVTDGEVRFKIIEN